MIYQTIYKELIKIVNLDELIKKQYLKFQSNGFMYLHCDFLRKDEKGRVIIALAHNYKQNGDTIPDPDMQIRIDHKGATCEALTYQDTYGYNEVYPTINNKECVNPKLKKDLNSFLLQLFKNIKNLKR